MSPKSQNNSETLDNVCFTLKTFRGKQNVWGDVNHFNKDCAIFQPQNNFFVPQLCCRVSV